MTYKELADVYGRNVERVFISVCDDDLVFEVVDTDTSLRQDRAVERALEGLDVRSVGICADRFGCSSLKVTVG